MTDYKTGYGKPPKDKQFEPGKSGNPGGRPKHEPDRLGEIVQEVMDAPMQYRENGRTKTATRREVGLKLLVERAIKGDVSAAELLLKKRRHALRHGQKAAQRLVVTDWLPDYPGQTGDQKAQNLTGQSRKPAPKLGKRKQGGRGQNPTAGNEPLQDKGG
jgi:hypothetical protein